MTQGQDDKKTSGEVAPKAVLRLVFREVLGGDRKKFKAKSNSAKSGGGARDFRFRPYDKFDGVFERMLLDTKSKKRVRNKKKVLEEIRSSTVNVLRAGSAPTSKPIEFEPPTSVRPNEGRLTRLNHYGLEVPSQSEGRVLLLLYQTGDKQLWLTFATEQQLQNGQWDKDLTDLLVGCMNAKRPATHAAQGFYDFALGTSFCKATES